MNLDENHKKLRRVCIFCHDFARQLSYHRALSKYRNQLSGRFNLNFWTSVYNNAIDIAVLEWCYLFKSHSDDLHWKMIVDDEDKFRNGLLKHLNINLDAWVAYRETIVQYRDKGVAHHECLDSFDVPEMTIALNATNFYYKYIVKVLPNLNIYDTLPIDLIEYYERSYEQTKIILSNSYSSTENIKEDSYFIF